MELHSFWAEGKFKLPQVPFSSGASATSPAHTEFSLLQSLLITTAHIYWVLTLPGTVRGALHTLAPNSNKTLQRWSYLHFTDKDTEALKGLQVTEQEPEPEFLWVSYHYTLLPRGICHLLKHGFVIIFNLGELSFCRIAETESKY